jgi:hypothetical protein
MRKAEKKAGLTTCEMADGLSPGRVDGRPSAVYSIQFQFHPEGKLVTHATDSTPGIAAMFRSTCS